MKVVIFCGGLGVRMGEQTQRIPKPMITVGGRPILWHIMKWYASWGHDEFILCLGYKGESIKEYFLNYNEALSNDFVLSNGGKRRRAARRATSRAGGSRSSTRDAKSTIAERLLAVAPHIGDDEYFLATYGDGLTDAPLAGHDRAPALVGEDRALPLGAPGLQRARRRDRRGRGRPLDRGPPAGGRLDQRRASSSSGARSSTRSIPVRSSSIEPFARLIERRRADRVSLRGLLGADGHDQGQAAPRRARRDGNAPWRDARHRGAEQHALVLQLSLSGRHAPIAPRARPRRPRRRHRDRLRCDPARAHAGAARSSRSRGSCSARTGERSDEARASAETLPRARRSPTSTSTGSATATSPTSVGRSRTSSRS